MSSGGAVPLAPTEELALAVLAGGLGSRLGGARKALLERDGKSLLAMQLVRLGSRFAERLVLLRHPADDPEGADLHRAIAHEHGARLVHDRRRDQGPPVGLEAALLAQPRPWLFLLGCDHPFVDEVVVDFLLRQLSHEVDAIALSSKGRPEPLCALYSRRCLPRLGELLDRGEASFQRLLAEVRTRLLPIEAQTDDPAAPSAALLARAIENVNTRESALQAGLRVPGD